MYDRCERRRLATYREVLLPQGATSMLATAVSYRGRDVACIILKRHGRHGESKPFRASDTNALARLMPTVALLDAGFQFLSAGPAKPPCLEPPARLTPRELQVARLACRGMTNAEVATLLGTSCETVKKQMRSVMGKMDVSNRTELAMMWASSRV